MSKLDIFKEIVNEQTEIADVIRSRSGNRKITTDTKATREKYSRWFNYSHEYRLRHIAYSELRGRSRDEIEKPKHKKLTSFDEKVIQRHKERYAQIIQLYKEKMEIMLNAMSEYFPSEIEYTKPKGGLFTWVTCPEYVNTREVFEIAVMQKVAYVIGSAFFPNGGGENTMRVNFSHPTNEKIGEGIKRLSMVLENALKKPKSKDVITGV